MEQLASDGNSGFARTGLRQVCSRPRLSLPLPRGTRQEFRSFRPLKALAMFDTGISTPKSLVTPTTGWVMYVPKEGLTSAIIPTTAKKIRIWSDNPELSASFQLRTEGTSLADIWTTYSQASSGGTDWLSSAHFPVGAHGCRHAAKPGSYATGRQPGWEFV